MMHILFLSCLTDWISAIGSIVSAVGALAAFWLARKIANNFDIKKQYHEKQFNLVVQLVKEMNNSRIVLVPLNDITLTNNVANGRIIERLDIKIPLFSFPHFARAYPLDKVWLMHEGKALFPFTKHLYNPMLPVEIANKLERLCYNIYERVLINEDSKDVILLSLLPLANPIGLNAFAPKDPIYAHFGVLASQISELQNSIREWMNTFGAVNINIRESFDEAYEFMLKNH